MNALTRIFSKKPIIILSLALAISCDVDDTGFQFSYTIEPVAYLRTPSPQRLSIPDSLIQKGNPYFLDAEKDSLIALQKEGDQWLFIADTIPANQSKTYTLMVKEEEPQLLAVSSVADGQLNVVLDDRPVLTYQMETILPPDDGPEYYQRGGFIHPAYAPNGEVITDGFPVGHTHQHGIFFAWVKTSYQGQEIDFWNQHKQNGTVVFDSLVRYVNGPVFTAFESAQTAIVLDGEDTTSVLAEQWKVRVFSISEYFMWDIEITQENITDQVLQIEPYHYGGMAFRGSADWNDTTATSDQELTGIGKGGFLTSEGLGRSGNHTRPNWVSMFGNVNNQPVSLVVMGHPDNFRTPQYVRIHPTMPYFCFTPVVEYGFDFKPGDIHRARYRVITFSGDPDPMAIDMLWQQFYGQPESKKVVL